MLNKEEYIELIKKCYNQTVYIYGAGKMAKIIYSLCKENNVEVKGFFVTDISENKNKMFNLPVLQFDSFKENNIVILIAIIEHGRKKIEEYIHEKIKCKVIDLTYDILELDFEAERKRKNPTMEITPIVGCSVNCRYCPQKLFINEYYKTNKFRKNRMSLEEFKICLEKLPLNTLVEFAGFVEPFLNEYSIDMMEYANQLGYRMTLFTTLVGLKLDDIHRILKIPFKQVVLHTADENGHANIPITDEYLHMLNILVEAKKTDGTLFIDSANCQSKPHKKVLEITEGKLKVYCEMSDRAGNLDNKDGNLTGGIAKGKIYCERSYKLNHNVLLPDGTVVLCCNDFGMRHVLGNLLKNSYEDIIKSNELLQVKRGMNIDENIPIICRKCMYAKNEFKL